MTTPTSTEILLRKAVRAQQPKSPAELATEAFLASPTGRQLCTVLGEDQALRNRIEVAFVAGIEAGINITAAVASEIVHEAGRRGRR